MLLITTKHNSKIFPASRIIGDDEIGGRIIKETGEIVREFCPKTKPRKNTQFWVTKYTGNVYKRIIETNGNYIWEFIPNYQDITNAVASAWIEPPADQPDI